MMTFALTPLQDDNRKSRHDFTVRRFSSDYELLVRLQSIGVDEAGAGYLIATTSTLAGVPQPTVTFHGARGPHTGFYQSPRHRAVLRFGEEAVAGWERDRRRRWPTDGMIRLGRTTSASTVAHELGHHLTQHLERPGVATHGKLWVGHFDAAARIVGGELDGVQLTAVGGRLLNQGRARSS